MSMLCIRLLSKKLTPSIAVLGEHSIVQPRSYNYQAFGAFPISTLLHYHENPLDDLVSHICRFELRAGCANCLNMFLSAGLILLG